MREEWLVIFNAVIVMPCYWNAFSAAGRFAYVITCPFRSQLACLIHVLFIFFPSFAKLPQWELFLKFFVCHFVAEAFLLQLFSWTLPLSRQCLSKRPWRIPAAPAAEVPPVGTRLGIFHLIPLDSLIWAFLSVSVAYSPFSLFVLVIQC